MKCFILLMAWFPLVAMTATLSIPLHLDWPTEAPARSWPVTVGVPFPPGAWQDAGKLGLADGTACKVTVRTRWPDGSIRWASVHFLARRGTAYELTDSPSPPRDELPRLDAYEAVVMAPAQITPHPALPTFYAIDSQDREARLKPTDISPVEGESAWRLTGRYQLADGTPIAAGVVYISPHAGHGSVLLQPKFIITEDTNLLWFKEIGVRIPLTFEPQLISGFGLPGMTAVPADGAWSATQSSYPHFGKTEAAATIDGAQLATQFKAKDLTGALQKVAAAAIGKAALSGTCIVSHGDRHLAVQVPYLARQFPTGWAVDGQTLTVKLWDSGAGQALDFRTKSVADWYLGHDFIPADHPLLEIPNNAQGLSKTHDIWLMPHLGTMAELHQRLGSPDRPVYAYPEPAWVAASGVFGPLAPQDRERFPQVEAAINDYFHRSITIPQKLFPGNGFLYFGMTPWGAQPWQQRADRDDRWYPTLHRLSRTMDYNLRRSMWQLFARSGDRHYYEFAKQNSRFFHDIIFSSWDSPARPLGWFAQGEWHSPIIWGHFPTAAFDKNYQPDAYNTNFTLTLASSADVAQFVYDYLLTGDLHSRDMALHWKQAMIEEMQWDVDRAIAFFRPDCFIRMLSSIYELDHDPRVKQYAQEIVHRIISDQPDEIFRPREESGARLNFGKPGEIMSAFYYYHVATGDPAVRQTFVKLARHTYRHAQFSYFFQRGSPLFQAFAIAHEETRNPVYAAYSRSLIQAYGSSYSTLTDEGIDLAAINQQWTAPAGRLSLVPQAPINVGLPVAMQTAAAAPDIPLPVALKTHPTQRTRLLLNKSTAVETRLDIHVNNWGHHTFRARLLDLEGREQPLEIIERTFKHVTAPETYDQNSMWVHHYADHIFMRLRIHATVPPGAYELDLGHEVNWTLLWSDIDQVQQEAPQGTVLDRHHRYYFSLPALDEPVRYFAHRPVQIRTPSGEPVATESLGKGHYQFTARQDGVWSVHTLDDEYTTGVIATDTFFRLETAPFIFAIDTPDRLFDVTATPPEEPQERPSLHLENRHLVLPLKHQHPRTEGTVEFWFKPDWSATDVEFAASTQRVQLYQGQPLQISYWIDPDNAGRTGRYNLVKLLVQFNGLGYTQSNVYFESGRWYHIAVSWLFDGEQNQADIFINGRKKAYYHYKPALPAAGGLNDLASGNQVKIGFGDWAGHRLRGGSYADLRISDHRRYLESFLLADLAIKEDAHTVMLAPLDSPEGHTIANGRLW